MSADPRSELGIVFIHHRTDAVTLNNLQSFRDWNPDATIVTMSAEQPFPDGYSIQQMPEWLGRWQKQTAKQNLRAKSTDFLLFAWYQNRREDCARWVVVEWDSYCACPVSEFFGELYDADVVGSSVITPETDEGWWWFCRRGSLPQEMQPYAAGIAPFSFVLFSDKAMSAMSQAIPSGDLGNGNGELRIGTLARFCGFHPWSNRNGLGHNDWRPLPDGKPLGPGMWHPVKWLVSSEHASLPTPQKSTEASEQIQQCLAARAEDGVNIHSDEQKRAQLPPFMDGADLAVIAQLLRNTDQVLEFGCGGSTLWLAQRVRNVQAIEHDYTWATRVISAAPKNAVIHWRPPSFQSPPFTPAAPGQYGEYLRVPAQIQQTFDACVVDGRARIESALAAAPWLKPGAWLFFHDWFKRERYTSRVAELSEHYEFCPAHSVTHSPQTMAVFRKT